MTDETLAEILSGVWLKADRADLHAALDTLLDDADAQGGRLDAPAFWGFVASLAQGRGVADEMEEAAASMVAKATAGKVTRVPDNPQAPWKAAQWAVLFHLLKRLRAFGYDLLPRSFLPVAFQAVAVNIVRADSLHPDLLGLGTARGKQRPQARAAQQLLVGAVLYRKSRDGITEDEARHRVLPPEGRPGPNEIDGGGFRRTWRDWKKRTAKVKGVPVERVGEDAEAAARSEAPSDVYELDTATVEKLWRVAHMPNAR